MSRYAFFRALLPALLVGSGALCVIAAEARLASEAKKLKSSIAECRAVTARSKLRAQSLASLLGQMSEESERAARLPISLADGGDALAGAVEQCAAAAGLSCAVSSAESDGARVELDVSLRAEPQELIFFLRELLARRELFLVERIECRRTGGDQLNAQLSLTAFVKKDSC